MHTVSPKEKSEAHNLHRTAQMGRNEPFRKNGRSFAKTIFWGKDFAKLRLMFLKFGGILNSGSRPQERSAMRKSQSFL